MRQKIRFDTDLVLIRILDHLSPQGTNGERCSCLVKALEEYKQMKLQSTPHEATRSRLPYSLENLEDPYHSIQQLLDLYLGALEEHEMCCELIQNTATATTLPGTNF